jgi:hypothetical protein
MTPTTKLRFVEREVKTITGVLLTPSGAVNQYSAKTVRILQQWWEKSLTINLGWTGDMPLRKAEGEWRDVPIEKE